MIIFRRRFHQLEKLVSVPNLLYLTTGAWGMDFISSSPLFSTTKFSYKSFLFQNFHNHSFFLHFYIMNNTCILCPQYFDWYSIREKVSNSIFIFRAISLTSVGEPICFLHVLPCLHMALSYQTFPQFSYIIAHVRISVGTSIFSKKYRRE